MSFAVDVQGETFSRRKKCVSSCSLWKPTNFSSRGYRSAMTESVTLGLRSINEAARKLCKRSPLPDDSFINISSSKKSDDLKFLLRKSQSVHQLNGRQSSKPGENAWKGASPGFLRKKEAPTHPIQIGDPYNPIFHSPSLETAERRGTVLDIARPHHRQPANYTNFEIEASSTAEEINRRRFDNPIMLEDKDFDSTSEDSDYSSSPSRLPIPLGIQCSANPPRTKHACGIRPPDIIPPTQTSDRRPGAQLSQTPGCLGPSPATCSTPPWQYSDTRGPSRTIQSPTGQPPTSTQPLRPKRPRPLPLIPTHATRPPIPSRNPARPSSRGIPLVERKTFPSHQTPSS
jgi:hypothetical protein